MFDTEQPQTVGPSRKMQCFFFTFVSNLWVVFGRRRRWDVKADDRKNSAETFERGSPVDGGGSAAPQDQRRAPHEGDAGDVIRHGVFFAGPQPACF